MLSLDVRLVIGRQWASLIASLPNDYRAAYTTAYPIARPDPTDRSSVDVCAHPEAWDSFQAFATRAIDGGALYEFLADPSHTVDAGVADIDPGDVGLLENRRQKFLAWMR